MKSPAIRIPLPELDEMTGIPLPSQSRKVSVFPLVQTKPTVTVSSYVESPWMLMVSPHKDWVTAKEMVRQGLPGTEQSEASEPTEP